MSSGALHVARTGLDAQNMKMQVIANNLANVNTTGFKRDRASFEDLLYQQVRQPGGSSSAQTQLPTGLQLGTGVRVVATAKNFSQGGQQQAGRALDVMVNGRGFFEVMMPDGSSAYTRDGTFQINAQGALEGSNVNVTDAMVNLISLARQFEMQIKLLQTADQNAQRANQLLSLSS